METRPKIWLETTHTLSRREGRDGVGHYTEELIKHLVADWPEQPFELVGNVFLSKPPHLPPGLASQVKLRLSRWFPGKVWNQLFRYGLMPPLNWLIPGHPELVVFFNFVRYPLSKGIKSLVAIHDLTFEHYPERVRPRNLSFLQKNVPRALRDATYIIAISEFTKRDIHERYGTPLEKIMVVPPGVDLKRYQPGIEAATVLAKYQVPAHYFVRVSTVEPRKNDITLIQAYRGLPEATRRKYALVIAGKVGWHDDATVRVLDEIKKGDPVGRIIHLGYVDDEDMPALYAGATAFVLASHFEGFGMPALEAMACGVPVLTSNTSAMPEVVQGAGLMVDPLDVSGFTDGLQQLAQNASLRLELSRKGRARAEAYSWKLSASKLRAAIEDCLSDIAIEPRI